MTQASAKRSRLMIGCGSAALALGLVFGAAPSRAQGIQADHSVVGLANVVTSGNQTTITVESSTAIINWTPQVVNGTTLTFLPEGSTATFVSPQLPGFAVLNRVLPADLTTVTQINGSVESFVQGGSGPVPGGFVAFYSPTGILIGNSASFDVGRLLLTTLDMSDSNFTAFATNSNFSALQLNSANSGSTARIAIAPNARITATPENAFFAVVAAEIEMLGIARVNGSHAYVVGDDVRMTFSNGLFNIQVGAGTAASGDVLTLGGTVGGPSSSGAGDNHIIYAMARASQDPISMLFSGNLGFETAMSAGVVNGEIILAANHNVFGRFVADGFSGDGIDGQFSGARGLSGARADISIVDAAVTSNLLAVSTHTAAVSATGADSTFAGNLLVVGGERAELTASGGNTLTVDGGVLVDARDFGVTTSALQDLTVTNAQAGTALIEATTGGTITVGGRARVLADAFAGSDFVPRFAGSATAGSAAISADGGAVEIVGAAEISARGVGASLDNVLIGGTSRGGSAELRVQAGGTVSVGQGLSISTVATGAEGSFFDPSTGSEAFGGTSRLSVLDGNGTITVAGATRLDASAFAGAANRTGAGPVGDAGEATITLAGGGLVELDGGLELAANGGGGTNAAGVGGTGLGGKATAINDEGILRIGGGFDARASGTGGGGLAGGNGLGGIAGARVGTGLTSILGEVLLEATGTGGDASIGFGGEGGLGRGGTTFLEARGTQSQTATLTIAGFASLNAQGFGGRGGESDGSAISAGRGGDGFGGDGSDVNQADPAFIGGSFVLAGGERGNLTIDDELSIRVNGFGGQGGIGVGNFSGGRGGDGFGGLAELGLSLFGPLGSTGQGSLFFAFGSAEATGRGGSSGLSDSGTPTGTGGNGLGGDAVLTVRAGNVNTDSLRMEALGFGGDGRFAGSGTGGGAEVTGGQGGRLTIGALSLIATGSGGFSQVGTGGNGLGGVAEMEIDGLNIIVRRGLVIDGSGFGGPSTGGAGGTGTGGEAYIGVINPIIPGVLTVAGHTELFANGVGGDNFSSFAAGDGIGGFAWIRVQGGGRKTFGSLQAAAMGVGGRTGGDQGGSGTGGIVRLNATGANSILEILRNVPDFYAVESIAGAAMLNAEGIGQETFGGNGIGGTGRGGTLELIVGPRGTINLPVDILSDPDRAADTLLLLAGGTGGDSAVQGGAGGAGFGGSFDLLVNGGTLVSGPASPSILGRGGNSLSQNLDVTGGNATGGAYSVRVLGGGALTIQTINNGGAGAVGGRGSGSGNGGNADAGTTLFRVNDSTANLAGHFTLSNNTFGGSGRIGGNAGGGSITLDVRNSSINLSSAGALDGRLLVLSSMTGGAGLQAGGNAQGTVIDLDVITSQISGGRFFAEQSAQGGAGLLETGTGGTALGGAIDLDVLDSTLTLTGGFDVSSFAFGGSGGAGGLGGAATAGAAEATFTDTTVTLVSAGGSQPRIVEVQSRASGGRGGTVGNATGSRASLSLASSTLAADEVVVNASVEARGLTAQTGGAATGGQAQIALSGTSTLQATLVEILGNAVTSIGGTARGGLSALQLAGGTTGALNADQLRLAANGSGGTAGGLNNLAGRFSLEVAGGNVNLGALMARAEGEGVIGTPLPSQVVAAGGNLNVSGTLSAFTVDNLLARTGAGGVIGGTPASGTTAAIVLETGGSLEVRGDGGTAGGLGGQSVQLLAGRSILIGGNLATRDGPVTVTANRGGGQALTQPPVSTITMTQAGRIDAGTGTVNLRLLDGAGDPQRANGAITLANIAAGRIDVRNLGTSAGSDIGVLASGVLSASGSGRAIDLAALNGEVINLAGDAGLLLTGGGHYGIFAATPTGSQIGSFANYARRYNVADAAAYDTLNPGGNFAAFRIIPTLTVSAADASRFYGDANPMFMTSISGFLPGDGPGDLTGAAQLTTLATPTSSVGAFAIEIALGTLLSEQGYQLALGGPGILTITPRPITVTADNLSRIYGNANPALTFTVGGLGLVNGDQLTGALATAAGVTTGVGNVAITQGTLAASQNYALTFNPGILSITPRPITITAENLAKFLGLLDPKLTFTVGGDGLVNGDQLSGSLLRDPGERLGTFAIRLGTLSAGPNYAATFIGGELVIKAPPTPREINNAIVLVGTGIGVEDVPGLADGDRNTRFGIDFPERPEEPLIAEDPLLDDPVASGGDASLYGSTNLPPAGDK